MGAQQADQMACSPIDPSIEEYSRQEQVIALSEDELKSVSGGWKPPALGLVLSED
jgi:bacteriocin-like protein